MEITKATKGSDQYLIDWCDYVIGELVREKKDLIKAYNYFNGVRDHYQYEHLEKNFGIGNPTSIGFTPLTRKHIEAIVGEYLSTKPQPKISCKDQRTLTNIFRDKQLEIAKKQKEWVSKYLENAIYAAIDGEQKQQSPVTDSFIEQELKNIKDSVSRSFLSNYEFGSIFMNTLIISLYSLCTFPLPIIFALILHAMRSEKYAKVVKTASYMPHFISTVVMVGIINMELAIRAY